MYSQTADGRTLAQRLCDLQFEGNRAINVEEFTVLAERVEKLSEILERHGRTPFFLRRASSRYQARASSKPTLPL
jgi:hypothetical protein